MHMCRILLAFGSVYKYYVVQSAFSLLNDCCELLQIHIYLLRFSSVLLFAQSLPSDLHTFSAPSLTFIISFWRFIPRI